jgi:hypothetical protein
MIRLSLRLGFGLWVTRATRVKAARIREPDEPELLGFNPV